jgi:hypothetical protein
MSQVTHPRVQQLRAQGLIALAAVLALLATTAVVLALTLGGNSSTSSISERAQPAVRADGGPEETGVAAAIGSQPTLAAPNESKIAAAVGSGRKPTSNQAPPDESAVAAAISH